MPEGAQGWRLEIKAYPKLTEKGAWRGGNADGSGKYGGFYTQEQVQHSGACVCMRAPAHARAFCEQGAMSLCSSKYIRGDSLPPSQGSHDADMHVRCP